MSLFRWFSKFHAAHQAKPTLEPRIKQLESQDHVIATSAAQTLGASKDPAAIPPLVRALGNNLRIMREGAAAAVVAEAAEDALIGFGGAAVSALATALSDNNWTVRLRAARALASIGDARAVAPLLARIGDSDSDVRGQVIEALVKFGEAARPALAAAAGQENKAVQSGAREALARLGRDAPETWIADLGAPEASTRRRAAEMLGRSDNPAAVLPLIECLQDDDQDLRAQAMQALLHTSAAVQPLIAVLIDNGNAGLRAAAVTAFADAVAFDASRHCPHAATVLRGAIKQGWGRIETAALLKLLLHLDDPAGRQLAQALQSGRDGAAALVLSRF